MVAGAAVFREGAGQLEPIRQLVFVQLVLSSELCVNKTVFSFRYCKVSVVVGALLDYSSSRWVT